MTKSDFPQIKVIKNQKNEGFAKANNQAIRQAQAKHILLLNPDTEFIENSAEKVLQFMNDHQDADIVGCQLLNANKSLQPSVRRFPTIYSSLVQLFKLHHFFKPEKILKKYLCADFDYTKTQKVDQVMGAFLMFRKELGLLDEHYFLWLEEVDLCRRAKNVYYTPITKIVHYGNSSFKQVATIKKQKYFYQSLLYYFKKFSL
jgi:GT2 family glycosyltransferase